MNLQEYFIENDLKVPQVAELSGVSESTIKRALKGKNKNSNSLKKLAKALDLTEQELTAMIQASAPSDYVTGLVHKALDKLAVMGLEFEEPVNQENIAVYQCIENDLRGDLNYFPDQFENLVKQATKKTQLEALKDLVLLCSAFMVDRETAIDMKNSSAVILRGGSKDWELRIFINTRLKTLQGVEVKLFKSKTGAFELEPVAGAHEMGLSSSTDDMELLLSLVREINAKTPLVSIKCPDQLRQGNDDDLKKFEQFCIELNARLAVRKNTRSNVFAYSDQAVSATFSSLVEKYLPALRIMTIQADDGMAFLINDSNVLHAVLIEHLEMIQKREDEIFPDMRTHNEDITMKVTNNTFNAPIENAVIGDHNHVEINAKLIELIPVLTELKKSLLFNSAKDSDLITSLDLATQQTSKSENYQDVIRTSLDKVKAVINEGTKAANLYEKAVKLFSALIAAL